MTGSQFGGIQARGTNDSSQNVGAVVGVVADGQNNGSGTVGSVYGQWDRLFLKGSGNITNAIGHLINSPSITGAGQIGNLYGEYINPETVGTSTNYELYAQGTSPFVITGSGNVGIGNTNPDANLFVSGTTFLGVDPGTFHGDTLAIVSNETSTAATKLTVSVVQNLAQTTSSSAQLNALQFSVGDASTSPGVVFTNSAPTGEIGSVVFTAPNVGSTNGLVGIQGSVGFGNSASGTFGGNLTGLVGSTSITGNNIINAAQAVSGKISLNMGSKIGSAADFWAKPYGNLGFTGTLPVAYGLLVDEPGSGVASTTWGVASNANQNYFSGLTVFGASTTPIATVDDRGTLNAGTSTLNNTLYVQNGLVGINQSSPIAPLDVNGNVNVGAGNTVGGTDSLTIGDANTQNSNQSLVIGDSNTENNNQDNFVGGLSNDMIAGNASLLFGSNNSMTANNSYGFGSNLKVNTDNTFAVNVGAATQTTTQNGSIDLLGGNVGVGTTAPGATLDVEGAFTNTSSPNNITPNLISFQTVAPTVDSAANFVGIVGIESLSSSGGTHNLTGANAAVYARQELNGTYNLTGGNPVGALVADEKLSSSNASEEVDGIQNIFEDGSFTTGYYPTVVGIHARGSRNNHTGTNIALEADAGVSATSTNIGLKVNGLSVLNSSQNEGSCTLNGGATATCTATVDVTCVHPVCSYGSSSVAHTVGCATSGTTLTAVSAVTLDTGIVNYICFN